MPSSLSLHFIPPLTCTTLTLHALLRTLSVAEPSDPEPRRWKLRRPAGARPMTTLATTLVEANVRTRTTALGSCQRCEGDVTLAVPMPKSRAHYSVGESCRTRLAAVSYSLVLKVTVKSKLVGVEKMELGGLEVRLASVSTSELRDALAHIERLRLVPPRPCRGEGAKDEVGGVVGEERRGVEDSVWSTTSHGHQNELEGCGDRRFEQHQHSHHHHHHHHPHHQQQQRYQSEHIGDYHDYQRKMVDDMWREFS